MKLGETTVVLKETIKFMADIVDQWLDEGKLVILFKNSAGQIVVEVFEADKE